MRVPRCVLLTGGTGLLGRYLPRDLLASGRRVAVLARSGREGRAQERVGAIVSSWEDALAVELPPPAVLEGDLGEPGLGLGHADRAWLGPRCNAVVHAAASVALCPASAGEPRRTNVEGTRNLLALCAELGLSERHHVSAAFARRSRLSAVPPGCVPRSTARR